MSIHDYHNLKLRYALVDALLDQLKGHVECSQCVRTTDYKTYVEFTYKGEEFRIDVGCALSRDSRFPRPTNNWRYEIRHAKETPSGYLSDLFVAPTKKIGPVAAAKKCIDALDSIVELRARHKARKAQERDTWAEYNKHEKRFDEYVRQIGNVQLDIKETGCTLFSPTSTSTCWTRFTNS